MADGRGVVLRTPFGEMVLRVASEVAPPSGVQATLAEQAGFTLRTGLEWGDRDALRSALELDGALPGSIFPRLNGAERLGDDQLALTAMAARLTEALRRGEIAVELLRVESLSHHLERPPSKVPRPPQPVEDKTTFFEVRLVDEVGQAISGLPVTFQLTSGPSDVTTNAAGVALLEGVTATSATVTVTKLDTLTEILKPRWQRPRKPSSTKPSNSFEVVFEGEPLRKFPITAALPHTVIIKPYFKCHEVPGAHFEFGRSFVRREGILRLAQIAQALSADDGRKAMIFGHTDLAGSIGLNKELSERRAKAIYALFVHDADAWEELFSGSADGALWKEKWDVLEAQHMLNTLGVLDDQGQPLKESGVRDASTQQAIRRFRLGDYPNKPAEQVELSPDSVLGQDGRRELFLAYAKRVSRKPIERARFSSIGGSPFMGCGEFNPLSLSAQDQESRRAVVFVFAPAAEPQALPCKLRSLGPCQANLRPVPSAPDPQAKPPYRCKVYVDVASSCPCQGGPDLSHDLLLRFPIPLSEANELSHVFILESEDVTIVREQALATDARAGEKQRAELFFSHLPETHLYRLQCREGDETYTLLDYGTLPELQARVQSNQSEAVAPDEIHETWIALKEKDIELEQDNEEEASA